MFFTPRKMIAAPKQFHAALVILFMTCWVSAPPCLAEEAGPPAADAEISRGLDFLAAQQKPDGSLGGKQKAGETGLALLAFLASGHAPNSGNLGKYGANVSAAIDFLLAQAQPDGSFGHSESPMYGQAMATLALAEAYGLDDRESRRKHIAAVLTASVKLIVAAQDVHKPEIYSGGWRYDLNSQDSDLTLTAWQVLALRRCLDVGINVQRGAFGRALKFVQKCYSAAGKGFANQPGGPADPTATCIAALCVHLLDPSPHPEDQATINTLMQKPLGDAIDSYCATWCQTLAAFQLGEATGRDVSRMTFDKLVKAELPDGSWPDAGGEFAGSSRIYTTSMALLTLAIPLRLLPAYP